MTPVNWVKQLLRRPNPHHIIEFIAFYLRRYFPPGGVILDIGCGRGQYAQVINGNGTYIGLDVTALPYAENAPRRVNVVGNAQTLPFSAGSFDIVMAVACFYQIPDYSSALHEIRRVLKPGGQVILFDYNRRTQQDLVVREGARRPCWTQTELRQLLADHDFQETMLHLPTKVYLPASLTKVLVPLQERFGIWAVVSGRK